MKDLFMKIKCLQIVVVLLISLSHFGCVKTYECKVFDEDSVLLDYDLSSSQAESIQFTNADDELLTLSRGYVGFSGGETIKCSESKLYCSCYNSYEIEYKADSIHIYLIVSEDENQRNGEKMYEYYLRVFYPFTSFSKRIESNEIINYEKILGVRSEEIDGVVYDNILEIIHENSDSGFSKFWIQKEKGIIKMWYKGKVWSVK